VSWATIMMPIMVLAVAPGGTAGGRAAIRGVRGSYW